jgi:peptide/nickel transport system substrate-binding protein
MKKLRFITSLSLFVVMVLAACTTPATPTQVPQPTTPPAAVVPTQAPAANPTQPPSANPTATTAQGTTTEFKEIPRNETVIFENTNGRNPVPDNYNPYINNQYLQWGFWQANQESLFYLNLETGKLIPWQAESYSFNADNTEVTIKIRNGVKWSDGVAFSADDVVFTINMLKGHPELQYSADMKQWVKDVVAKDPQTVVITFTSPNPRFVVDYFSVRIWESILIAPKHIWEDKDPLTFTNYDIAKGWPVGTGPYKIVRSTETETDLDLLDTWWAAETGFHAMPAPKRAIWEGVANEEIRAAKAVNNELDAMWTLSRSTFETAVKKNPNIIGWTTDLPYAYLDACPRHLALNNAVAPFDDAEVRWAVNYALNRDQIIAIAWEGMTDPAESYFATYGALKALIDRNSAFFKQYPVLTSDPAKTAEIMTKKGYTKDSQGLFVGKDGKHITFTIITWSSETDKVKMGPVIVDQLRAAGFDVDFQPLESSVFFDQESKGTATAWIGDMCASVADPYQAYARFHSRNYVPVGQDQSTNPPVRYKNPELDKIIDQMQVMSPDDPKYNDLADQGLAMLMKDMPVIPLVQARLLTPFNNTYWTNWPTALNNYIQPGHWWITGNLILDELKPAK